MDEQIREQLAYKMGVLPEDIMDYAQKEDGTYTVILFSFQKYTGIGPDLEPEEKETVILPEYYPTYLKPRKAKKVDLVDLANYLGLTVKGKNGKPATRHAYLLAVQAYKAQN